MSLPQPALPQPASAAPPAPPVVTSKPGPSWAAWTALALSSLAFLMALTIGVLSGVDRLSADSPEVFFDAGTPSWGEVELTPSGAVTDSALTTSVTEAFTTDASDAMKIEDVLCEALPAPRKDTVTTCDALVDGFESTVVVYFLDDEGSFLATIY